MYNRFELAGFGISIALMVCALYLIQVESSFFGYDTINEQAQSAAVSSGIVFVEDAVNETKARTEALLEAADNRGNLNRMVIDDIRVGTGETVKNGDSVVVHYVGTLQSGEEFDNSNKRGTPFEFKVGEGRVIKGWEEGLIGMKVGGQRILVIPPDLAYGNRVVGPIPASSTLVFSIELLEIK